MKRRTEKQRERHARAQERNADSLHRAESGDSVKNDLAVIEGFAARGIEATPRVDVFTYGAWRAKGRQVMKRPQGVDRGAWGVKICAFVRMTDRQTGEEFTRPKTVSVFHVSQTKPMEETAA